MNKKLKLIGIIISILLFSCNIVILADDSYSLPHGFEGYVTDTDGNLVPDGTIISAKLDNEFFNTSTTNGAYGSLLGNDEFIVYGDNEDTGKIIYFYINDVQSQQTSVFTPFWINIDDSTYFNLSLTPSNLTINSVSVKNITSSQAVVQWVTNFPANSTVNYGKTKPPTNNKYNNNLVYNHEITIEDLQSDTKYYYEILSYDAFSQKVLDKNFSEYYHFITLESESNGNQNGNGGGGSGNVPPIQPSNQEPTADANGPYYGLVNTTIVFDATNSNDSDGYISMYDWNLGDGTEISTQNSRVSHIYSQPGNYTVELTVIDNKGLDDSTATHVLISTNDTDNDGWTNEAEALYGTDPENASDYPIDSDKDGIPNISDVDDDNDNLSDIEEDYLGTNKNDNSDVILIINDYGIFFILDTDLDGEVDTYYNKTSNLTSILKKSEEGFLIDVDNDGTYDYIYESSSGLITIYKKDNVTDGNFLNSDNFLYYILFLVILTIIFCLVIVIIKKKKK